MRRMVNRLTPGQRISNTRNDIPERKNTLETPKNTLIQSISAQFR